MNFLYNETFMVIENLYSLKVWVFLVRYPNLFSFVGLAYYSLK